MEELIVEGDDKRKVLAYYRDLQVNIATILHDAERGDLVQVIQTLKTAQTTIKDVGDYLSASIETKYYHEHRALDSVTAQKVFEIPELLELILDNLDIPNIMICYGVCRTMRDSIEASNKLQTKLCLRAAPRGTSFFTPFPSCYILCFKPKLSRGLAMAFDQRVKPDRPLPSVGTRWRSMLICQPPIFKLEAQYACFSCYMLGERTGVREVNSSTGLTLEDVYKVAESIFEQHRDCPGHPRDSGGNRMLENGESVLVKTVNFVLPGSPFR